jgi:carboxyl-terminal processing protease
MKQLLPLSTVLLLMPLQVACAHTEAPPAAAIEAAATAPVSPYAEVATAINAAMRANHYAPAELDGPAYAAMETGVIALANSASSDEDFLTGFKDLWKDGPFSHVILNKSKHSASETAAYLDTLRVGEGAKLSWQGDAAILTVNTMVGLDTVEQIDAAYDEIAAHGASRLVIDLHKNPGGAFAVLPLVEHVLSEPLDAGGFVAQRWNAEHNTPPTLADLKQVTPWTGWSIRSFWTDVTSAPLTRIRFEPRPNAYQGPVFVLISHETASAAELAADALKSSGRAVLIGETTAGEMLSQKMFDIPGGYQLYLPIADYYSVKNGRIEGHGVTPDIICDPDLALEKALEM